MCVFVCLQSYLSELDVWSSPKFFVHVSYGRGSVLLWQRSDTLRNSGFWMTSSLYISWGCSMSQPGWGSVAHMQRWAGHIGIPVAGSWCSGLLLALRTYEAAVGMLNIYDIMFAHNVPAYIVTRKWCVLKVTPQMATPGVESAVYDCLVFFCAK